MVGFMAWRVEQGDTAGVKEASGNINKWADFSTVFVVRQALKGMRRLLKGRGTHRPVSWDILRAILAVLGEVCEGEVTKKDQALGI